MIAWLVLLQTTLAIAVKIAAMTMIAGVATKMIRTVRDRRCGSMVPVVSQKEIRI